MAVIHTRKRLWFFVSLATVAVGMAGSAWVVDGISTPAEAGAPKITKRAPYTISPPADADYASSGVLDNRSWRSAYDEASTGPAPVYGASVGLARNVHDRNARNVSLASRDVEPSAIPEETYRIDSSHPDDTAESGPADQDAQIDPH